MKTRSFVVGNPLLLAALGGAAIGGVIGARWLLRSGERSPDLRARASRRQGIMARMIERLPPESPPKLVMTILPRLREQNDDIIALLREQNELLRRGQPEPVIR
jgi:hypothetical protein